MKITYEADASKSEITPTMSYTDFDVEMEYINRILGLKMDP